MKRIVVLLFLLASLQDFGQIIPSAVGQVYNFCIGDSFEYSYTEQQGPCGPSGSILDIITAYNISGDTITYTYTRLRSLNNSPCPNYNPPYGIIFDSTSLTQQVFYADSSIFSVNQSIGTTSCQGLTTTQCYDSTYIAVTGNFVGRKLNEYHSSYLNFADDIWMDSLGLVNTNYGQEGDPPINYQIDLYFYRKSCNGATWGTFEPFPDYSMYLGISDMLNGSNITLYPNPATTNFELQVAGASGFLNGSTIKLSVRNLLGQQVFEQNLKNNKTEVDCNLWSKGIYIWSVLHNGVIAKSGKLVIE